MWIDECYDAFHAFLLLCLLWDVSVGSRLGGGHVFCHMARNGCDGPWPIGSINSSFIKRFFLFVIVTFKQLRVVNVLSLSFKLQRVVLCSCFLFYVAMR